MTANLLVLVASLSLVLCCAGTGAGRARHPTLAPTYVVNLDLPPEERWTQVVEDYKPYIQHIQAELRKIFPRDLLPLIEYFAENFEDFLPEVFAREIIGIAKVADVPEGDVFLLNCVYELTAYCTSIVGEDSQGRIWHGRNFDYGWDGEQVEFFKNITLQVDYQRNGKTAYFGTTLAGYVGLPTGQKPGVFTLSMNERDKGNIYENFFMAFYKGGHPAPMVMREVFDNATSYKEAVLQMSAAKLVSDGYFIFGGINPGEGVVITRDRMNIADTWALDLHKSRWFLVETNYDHWLPPPTSDDRRTPAVKAMNGIGQEKLTNVTLLSALNTNLVLNRETVMTTVMRGADPSVYRSWIRYDVSMTTRDSLLYHKSSISLWSGNHLK